MTRDEIGERYLASLQYPPYPVQEEAILAWFTSDQGALVCAPTGTGKTLIAEAALFEALHTGKVAYYTTPLIALTEQKFQEMQRAATRWGFDPDEVGLVTGHRRVNPHAKVLVVVAEILLNRLLNQEEFGFGEVAAVVMDEFHSFADQQRGIVWELSLAMLPKHVRLLLLSATVGNAHEFLQWLERSHDRKVELVEGTERKVPLTYHWVPDQLLDEQLVIMAQGDDKTRKMPALVFCFNRDQCWATAEMLKGKDMFAPGQKVAVNAEVDKLDWPHGVGPKMKQLLRRGVGVHHAGLLPKYRRAVEDLFVRKLLSVVVCTETLAAGINLPARSVVLTSLVKGPPGKEKVVDASTGHQIFGRAGRPQFDTEGHVYVLAHEDDVKLSRWQAKYDQIPKTTKDPGLLKARKDLDRKKPTKRSNQVYWNEAMFEKLKAAPPAKLYSKGPLPWRLLAYLLKHSPEVSRVRTVIRKRLMDAPRIAASEKTLDRMLATLAAGGFVTLDPPLPPPVEGPDGKVVSALPDNYVIRLATPTPKMDTLLVFRSVHPLYGAYLLEMLGKADRLERLQALESVLELPRPLLRYVRVPWELPPGKLASESLDQDLVARGLMVAKPEKPPGEDDDEFDDGFVHWEDRPPGFADKLKLLFDAKFPDVTDVEAAGVWAAAEVLNHGGNFNLYVKSRDLTKQEGIIFRHLLRLILLCGEFAQVCPPDTTEEEWKTDLLDIAGRLTESCRAVDPDSTEEMVKNANAADVVEGEKAKVSVVAELVSREPDPDFGVGILDPDEDPLTPSTTAAREPAHERALDGPPAAPADDDGGFGAGILDD